MSDAIRTLEGRIKDASQGLSEDVFLFATRITPMVNVDLLIQDDRGRTLLTWRDDGYYPAGWHFPGGIIRFKETFAQRIHAVALDELGTDVDFQPTPLALNEVIHPTWTNRAHFVSPLYACTLRTVPDPERALRKNAPRPGEWAWHETCPKNLIAVHDMYRPFMGPDRKDWR